MIRHAHPTDDHISVVVGWMTMSYRVKVGDDLSSW